MVYDTALGHSQLKSMLLSAVRTPALQIRKCYVIVTQRARSALGRNCYVIVTTGARRRLKNQNIDDQNTVENSISENI